MNRNEFSTVFSELVSMYPKWQTPNEGAWFKRFEKVNADTFNKAIDLIADDPNIDTRFPPNAIQMMRLCKQVEGARNVSDMGINTNESLDDVDELRLRQYNLERKFEDDRHLDPQEWQDLHDDFLNQNRIHAADFVMIKFRRLEKRAREE